MLHKTTQEVYSSVNLQGMILISLSLVYVQRGGLMTRQSVPWQNNVVVLPRTSTGQTNAIGT